LTTALPKTEMSVFADTVYKNKYAHEGEEWADTARRVVSTVVSPYFPEDVEELTQFVIDRKFMPGGRYLYATGKPFHQTQNCLLLDVEDSRESWADLMYRITSGLMTGAGIGVVYSKLRGNGAPVKGMGGKSTGPLALINMVNEAGRHIMQGGSRRSAIWAGLHWNHPDIREFIRAKNWSDDIVAMKAKDFNAVAPLDMTNISVILDDDFFTALENPRHHDHHWAWDTYWLVIEQMLKTGEPGFSVDINENAGEHLRNACTEITSRDDNDICNLGSINLARVENIEEMARITELATRFLLCGTLYSKVPYQGVADTREKNRRLGLGLMGIYEWLVVRGKPYAPDRELETWLEVYATSTEIARAGAVVLGVSEPVKTRALAPVGTIGIVAETSTSMEPIYGVSYKRRYLKGTDWHFQYVIEPLAKKFAEQGIDVDTLETAFSLAQTPEKRLAFQAWIQKFVDHGISSTVNLPSKEEQSFTTEEFGATLLKYLPQLRGVTVYPDGSRGGQPLTVVPYSEAVDWEGYEYQEYSNENSCAGGTCGL
jgi:ribonucleoside-diphosphate reductase alpha chain